MKMMRRVIRPGMTLEELRKRTGITRQGVLKFALAEMLCNVNRRLRTVDG